MTSAARARHTAGRALLRRLVAIELGCRIEDVVVHVGPRGHPVVDARDLAVSISHTRGLVVAALAWGRAVGVDVERTTRSPLPPARLWLGPGDQRRLAQVPDGEWDTALVRCWTAKEAAAKASGAGLGLPLRTIEVDGDRAWVTGTPTRGWDGDRPRVHHHVAVAWSGVAPGPTATCRGGAGAPQSAGAGQSSWNCPATMPGVAVTGHVPRVPSDARVWEGQTTLSWARGTRW